MGKNYWKPENKKIFFLLLLLGLFKLYPVPPSIDMKSLDHKITKKEMRAIDKGNSIIKALDEYYKDNGFYPQTLKMLVPEYLVKIEKTGLRDYPFSLNVKFQYKAAPIKYRPGWFRIYYPDYEKNDIYYYYDSRDDKIKKNEYFSHSNDSKWIDKISEREIKQIAEAVKQYFNDYKKFPEKISNVVPQYLTTLPITLNPRYEFDGKIWSNHISYIYQEPLKDAESAFAQNYYIHFRYDFDYEFRYFSDNKKWEFWLH